jgi:Fic family protein
VPNWDEDSPQLRENLAKILAEIVRDAELRERPSREMARQWQALFMEGLDVPDARFAGAYRGEPGLEHTGVRVGANYGVAPSEVSETLRQFEAKLQTLVAELDALLPVGQDPTADQLAAIVDLCAWAHAEWIRIHPFANGNGRTARLWANWLSVRYGLPPFIRLRPRPDGAYGDAGAKAMRGDWKPTAVVFHKLLDDFLDGR